MIQQNHQTVMETAINDANTVCLSAFQASFYLQKLSGVPGGAFTLILPNQKGLSWLIENATSSTVTVQTVLGTGVPIPPGVSALVKCADGINLQAALAAHYSEIVVSIEAKPTAGQVLLRYPITRPLMFHAGLPGAFGYAGATATASAPVTIKRIPAGGGAAVQFGTATFGIGAANPVFAAAADQLMEVGSVLLIVAPVYQDATLAQLGLNLIASLTS